MQSPVLQARGVTIARRTAPWLILALLATTCPAAAADSLYQTLDLRSDCAKLTASEEGDSASFLCHGPAGVPFVEDYGDLRSSVTYGVGKQAERAWQSFGPFNAPGPTIEWRYEDGVSRPIATIRRWRVETGSNEGEPNWSILVVSRVAQHGEGGCTIGYVDSRRIDHANLAARIIADAGARNFRCRQDEPLYRPDDEELRAIVSR